MFCIRARQLAAAQHVIQTQSERIGYAGIEKQIASFAKVSRI